MGRNSSRQGWHSPGLILILLAGYALRLHELTRQDIWWDEARNIDVALRPFSRIATAPELDIHPPLYFWLLHLLGAPAAIRVGDNPAVVAFVARFLSVAAGVAGIALVYQLARTAGNRRAGLATASVAALAPFWLAESQEARMYTVAFALLTGAALALLQLIAHDPAARDPRPVYRRYARHGTFVLLSTLALLTHYNVVFVLVAWYLWWAVWALTRADRGRQLAVLVACGLTMTLLLVPLAPIALRQIPGYANPNLVVPGIGQYLGENWRAYVGGYAFAAVRLPGDLARGYLGAVLVVLVVGLLLWRGDGWRTSFLLVWLGGALALYYLAVMDRGAFNVRYSSFVTPALYALLGVALVGLGRLWRPLTGIALALLLLGLVPAVQADLYAADFAREDISGVTTWLRGHAGPEDAIFVDQKYPFGFYYDRYAIDLDAVPTGREVAPARYLFVDINTIDAQLNAWARDAEHVYWVQWFESDTDPRRSVSFLLDKAGARGGEEDFHGYSIDWWTLTPPTTFELAPRYTPLGVHFEQGVEAAEIALPAAPLAPGDTLFGVIRWQRTATPAARPLKARVALYDAGGTRVAQADERVLNDRHLMPAEWAMTDNPLNVYKLATPADLAPGTYSVGLLVYDAETLDPFGYLDAAGNPAGVETTVGTVIVQPPQANTP